MRFIEDFRAAIGRHSGQGLPATSDSIHVEQARGEAHGLTTPLAWRLAGALFIGSALMMVPAILLLGRSLDAPEAIVVALAVGTGASCLWAAERQLSRRWLAVVPIVAIAETAAMVQATDYVLSYLYFFVALFVAVVFPKRMAPYLALIGAALLLRFTDTGVDFQEGALWTLAVGLPLTFTAVAVGRLTANLESSRATYQALLGVDDLTGVGNYRALIERLRHETLRHSRKGRQFALLNLDLDGFKSVNDTQGHLIGDLVLVIVASMIGLEVRGEDAVYRHGGDEFSVIAPETNRDQAWLLAARIEREVRRLAAGPVKLSVSFGVAVFPEDGAEPAELLDAADISLRTHRLELANYRSRRVSRGTSVTGA
ncbi:MAG: GGDEF domain-containing protein [Solirubrobacterales bacterium]